MVFFGGGETEAGSPGVGGGCYGELRRGNGAESRLLSGGSSPRQISGSDLRRHVTSQLVIFSNVMLKTIAWPRCEDDECVSVEKLRSSPLFSLPPLLYRLLFYFSADFFNLNRFLVKIFGCLSQVLFAHVQLLRRALVSLLALPGNSCHPGPLAETPRGRKFSHCSFHLQLFKHDFDVLNFRSNLKNGSVQNDLLIKIKPSGSKKDSTDLNGTAYPGHTLKCPKSLCQQFIL